VNAGEVDRGLQLMREGLQQIREAGGELLHQFMRVLFAESCLVGKFVDEGMKTLGQALEGVDRFDTRILESEIHRIRGEFHRLEHDNRAAEQELRDALRIARAQEARGWELRAATSLAHFMIAQERHGEARAILAPVYNWFTEGFQTGDLREARVVLDQTAL
jgi:predicted ATPase